MAQNKAVVDMSREVESFESCSAWEGANGLPG